MKLRLDDQVKVELTDEGAALYNTDEFQGKVLTITGSPDDRCMKLNKGETDKLSIETSLRAFIALFGEYFFDFDKGEHHSHRFFVDNVIEVTNVFTVIPNI